MGDTVKVVSIIGKGRSGSTLLDRVLGQAPGFVSTGELGRLWEWGLVRGWRCGCARPVPDCPFWSAVVDDAFGDHSDVELGARIHSLQTRILRWPNVPRLLGQKPRQVVWPHLGRYLDVMSRLYLSIARVAGASVVVDSTKWPAYPTPLGLVSGVESYVVQLVRDPRAVTHSWQRRKEWSDRPDGTMPQYGVWYSMASWWARNLTAEFVRTRSAPGTSLLVRYEDFVSDPTTTVARILHHVVDAPVELPFINGRTIDMDVTHTTGGNPDRIGGGSITLREDDAWRESQARRVSVMASLLGAPLMWRYGYPVVPFTGDRKISRECS